MITTPASGSTPRSVTLRDRTVLAVYDSGSRTADQTVVFLHGFCLTHASWNLQIAYLRRRYGDAVRLIAYDHRGHGQSSPAPMRSYRIEQLADDLAQVLTALEVTGPVTLAGHSMGGMAALAYLGRPAAARPVEPHGLVLVATAAGKLRERGIGRLLSGPVTPTLYGVIDHTPEQALRALVGPVCALLGRWQGSPRAATFAALAIAALTSTPVPTAVGFLPSLRVHDQYAALAAITARTVVLSGGLDPLTPPVHARELADGIPGAQLVPIPGVGHMLPQQAPQVVNAAICHALSAPVAGDPRRGRRSRRSRVLAAVS